MAHTSVFILTPDFPAVDSCAMIGGSYEEAIAAAKRMGYDGVEITMGDPALFDAGAFQAALDRHGMKVSAINSGGIEYCFHLALVSDESRKAESALRILKGCIEHCAKFGCSQQIGVARGFAVPGRPLRWFKDRLVDVLKEATACAARLSVPVVFEYTNRFEINTINTGAEAREIVERVASPNLGILVDTYHSFLEDPDVCQNLRDLGSLVRHLHLHDSNRGAALIAGGENDFDRIIRTCGEVGYHGWFSDGLLTLQYSEEQLRQSTAGLKQLYEKYGV